MNGGLLLWIGRGLGILGMLVCGAAVIMRLAGQYFVGTYQLGTLFLSGTAAMIGGCFCLLWVLVRRSER
jgi:hypothetical protein